MFQAKIAANHGPHRPRQPHCVDIPHFSSSVASLRRCGADFGRLVEDRCLLLLLLVTLGLLTPGCSSTAAYQAQQRKIANGDFMLSTTNGLPGSTYRMEVYCVAAGDTIAQIATRFHTTVDVLKALNPGLRIHRLYIGQKLRVFEELKATAEARGSNP